MTHTLVLRPFDDRPFRVIHVGPPNLIVNAEFEHEASRTHALKLRIDPDVASREPNPQITIRTDIEDQPAVSVSVVILPSGV